MKQKVIQKIEWKAAQNIVSFHFKLWVKKLILCHCAKNKSEDILKQWSELADKEEKKHRDEINIDKAKFFFW